MGSSFKINFEMTLLAALITGGISWVPHLIYTENLTNTSDSPTSDFHILQTKHWSQIYMNVINKTFCYL